MQVPPDDTDASGRLSNGWWLIRAGLLIVAVGLATASSTLLLAGGWGESIPPSAAAYRAESVEVIEAATQLQLATPTAIERAVPSATPTARPATLLTATPFGVDEPSSSAGVASTPRPVATATPAPPAIAPALVPESTAAPPAPSTPTSPPPQPATPTSTPVPPPPSCPSAAITGYASPLFAAINQERTSSGLPPLGAAGCVTYVAQIRSDDMASLNYFAHTSPSGESAFSLLDDYRVPHGWAGENLARNNYPDDQTVDIAIRDLMASDGHRANILSTNFTSIGVAAAFDGAGMKYFTMIFIGPP